MSRAFFRCTLLLVSVLIAGGCGSAATQAPVSPGASQVVATPVTRLPTAQAVPTTPATQTAPTAQATAATQAIPQTIVDLAGRKVTFASVPKRIVSLTPSNTEIMFALDLGSEVIAVDDFSDFPAEAKKLPKIGGTTGTFNIEQILALQPDLILASGITPDEMVKKFEDLKLPTVVLGTVQITFEQVLESINLLGQITDRAEQARQITDRMQQKFDSIKAKAATAKTKPRVYWEIDATDASKPYTVGPGTFIDDLITFAGGANVFESASSPYPQVSGEQVIAANPEVIILADAEYGGTPDALRKRPGWPDMDAMKQQRIYPIDTNLVSRPGPRLVDGFEEVAKAIHPELFQ